MYTQIDVIICKSLYILIYFITPLSHSRYGNKEWSNRDTTYIRGYKYSFACINVYTKKM
jgi:hypothetical protein